jgi:hypothetical protein
MAKDPFASLKRSREESVRQLNEKADKLAGGKTSYVDERIWKPTKDKAGNADAVIRFLDTPLNAEKTALENSPVVQRYSHGFEVNGKWLIEDCPTTLGLPCPICDANSELWNTGLDSNKKIASSRKRKLSYYANIYVISDQGNPENEGKVFLYRFGRQIWDIIEEARQPQSALDEAMNPFDMWTGANLRVRVRKNEGGYDTYTSSAFESPKPLSNSDDKIKEIWLQAYPLEPEISPTLFKSYDELKTRFDEVVGNKTRIVNPSTESAANTLPEAEMGDIEETAPFDGDEDTPKVASKTKSPEDFLSQLNELTGMQVD